MRKRLDNMASKIDEQTLAVLRCVGVLIAVVLIGTLGFHLLEHQWTFWDSFYFTVVTISTVGYGDYEINDESKVFAALLILCGIGTFTYSLSTLVQIASDIDAAMRRKMKQRIAKCQGHVIICGYGRMGRRICNEISRGELDCVVVECDEENIESAIQDGRLVVEGEASEDEILLKAGIERAQGIVCAVDSDATNMFITVTAKSLNPKCRIVSRSDTIQASRKLEQAGASMVISPHQIAGKMVATAFVHPRLTRFLHTGDESAKYFEMGEVIVEENSAARGLTVAEFGSQMSGVVFVAIERESGELLIQPRGGVEFHTGDIVIFAGSADGLDRMRAATICQRTAEAAPA